MALVVKDRVRETSVTQGTGTFTLAGAVTGYQSFSAIGNGNTTYYTIYLQASNEWEVGIGTYTASGTTLSRDTILASSNGGSVVNFSAGTKDVFVTYPAGRSVYYDTATNVSLNALTVAGAFAANGGATLGDASGDALTINSSAVSTPNGLNFDSNTFVIDATNNRVGIGAASPAKQLDLAANNTGITTGDPLNTLRFTDTDITSAAGQPMGRIEWFSADTDTAGVKAYIQAQATDGSPDADMVFATNHVSGGGTAERMRIQYDGNVGIGTNAPVAQLQVNRVGDGTYASTLAESRSKAGLILNPESTGSSVALNISKAVGGNAIIYQPTNSAATTAYDNIFNPFGGNVGIGTVTPAAKLSVDGSAIFNDSGADVDFRVESDNNTHMLFVDAGNDRVGIGTSTPVSVFDVAGITPVLTIKDTQSKTWAANDTVGDLDFYSTDPSGTGPRTVARIRSFADNAGTTAAGALSFWTSAADSAATEKMRLTKEGYVLVGTTASLGTAGVQAAAVATDPFEGYRFGANANGPTVSLYKNRGATVGTNAVVVSGDELGTIAFRGYDGAAYRAGAFITGYVDGTPGASDMPGRLTFSTTADGAATPTERMRITSGGQVNIGGNFTSTNNTLQVTGNAAIGYTTAAPTTGLIVAGNVGIGTDTAGQRLTVVGTANDTAQFQNSVSYGTVLQVNATATGGRNWKIHATANGDGVVGGGYFSIIDATANAYRLNLDSSGNLGLGGISPVPYGANNRVLQIDGGANASEIRLTNNTTGTAAANGGLLQMAGNDLYIWNVENSFISFGTNNAERMRLDASGNLGLGVTPSGWRTGFSTRAIQVGLVGSLSSLQASTTNNQTFVSSNTFLGASDWVYLYSDAASQYRQYAGQHNWFTAASGTANTTTITNGVSYTIITSGNQTAFGAANNNVGTQFTATSSGTLSSGTVSQNVAFTQAMTLDASGNLGIGQTNPSTWLVNGLGIGSGANDWGATIYTGTANTGYLCFADGATGLDRYRGYISYAHATNAMIFATDAAERARITSGGYFKASNDGTYNGSTSSYHELRQTSATAGDATLVLTATNASLTGDIVYARSSRAANTAFRFYVANANGTDQFYVRGDGAIYAQNTTVQSISDARLKENIRNASEGLDVITALRPVRYDWKPGYGNDRKDQLGFIAQEVESVFSEAVSEWKGKEGDETYKTVGPGALIPVLVKAIQEQQAMINELKAEMAALKGV